MNTVKIIIENNEEHKPSVGALLASIIKNKYQESTYQIYLYGSGLMPSDIHWDMESSNVLISALSKGDDLSQLGKVIYLNWNVIVTGDLTDLYRTDLGDYSVAAALNLPAQICLIPSSTEVYNTSVLVADLQKTGNIAGAIAETRKRVKELSPFYNLGYTELMSDIGKYQLDDLESKLGSKVNTLQSLADQAVVLRADMEHLPEKYFDTPMSAIWLAYYKMAFADAKTLLREAYTETIGKLKLNDNNEAVAIAIPVQDETVMFAVALLHSFLENSKSRIFDIRIFYRNLSEKHKKMLLAPRCERMSVVLYKVQLDTQMAEESQWLALIPQAFSSYQKVLFMDPKRICMEDIGDLYDYPMEGYYLRGTERGLLVNDENYKGWAERLVISNEFFLDTSLLMVNTELWLQDAVSDRIAAILQVSKKEKDPFLSALYKVCGGKIEPIPYDWNYHENTADVENAGQGAPLHPRLYRSHYCMYHFSGAQELGNPAIQEPIESLWKYLSMSPFYEELREESIKYAEETNTMSDLMGRIEALEKMNKDANDQLNQLRVENENLIEEKNRYLFELLETRKSVTYKMGRMITFLPRKLMNRSGS